MCCLAGYTENCDERVHRKNSSLHMLNTTNEFVKNTIFNALCKKENVIQNISKILVGTTLSQTLVVTCPWCPYANLCPNTYPMKLKMIQSINSLIVPGLANCTPVSLAESVAVVQSFPNHSLMIAFYKNLTSYVTGLSHQISNRLCQNLIQHVCKHIHYNNIVKQLYQWLNDK